MFWKTFACLAAATASLVIALPARPVHADDTGLAQSLHDVRREGKRLCLTDHFHVGTSAGQPNKKAAMAEAIDSYQGFTALEYGTDWASFSKAASKTATCTRGSGGWGCEVQARACK